MESAAGRKPRVCGFGGGFIVVVRVFFYLFISSEKNILQL